MGLCRKTRALCKTVFVSRRVSKVKQQAHRIRRNRSVTATDPTPLSNDYFRIRDFEYVQPLYDLAFLLEVDALANGAEVPKYRTFSLWRAAYSLDGYGTTIDRWLDGTARDQDLDYVPSARIREYLTRIRKSGTVPELASYRKESFARCLRLRSVRGLGPSQIALAVSSRSLPEDWFSQAAINLSLHRDRITELYNGVNVGPWQTAHIVPPLFRFLRSIERSCGEPLLWDVAGIPDVFQPVTAPVDVFTSGVWNSITTSVDDALREEKHFRRMPHQNGQGFRIKHQMGWSFSVQSASARTLGRSLSDLARTFDPLAAHSQTHLISDLHLHTAWSDGSASVDTMAKAVVASGLKYFAVTDHSRSSKLQGGLTPVLWLRQANALTLASPVCPVLHGIEVDILKDGTLDLPHSLLHAAELVIASVHSNWTDDARENTDRLLKAIESGCVDIIGHPTSAIVGKPGVPDYVRAPAQVHWSEVFEKCAQWQVALEFNCFPSRLDLPLNLLQQAIDAGCAISLGSDAHARSHLLNLRFGEAAWLRLSGPTILNRFSYAKLRRWVDRSRAKRKNITKSTAAFVQPELFDVALGSRYSVIEAVIEPPQRIPKGSRVVGIDLTAGDKATGVAVLDGSRVETCSLFSDDEILTYVRKHRPKIVSIDSPLGLPGGRDKIDPKAGIVRVAEHDLASVGIPAYPALIDSMEKLTLRGIRLRRAIEQFPRPPRVIESYPGAAQDILCIPRKQKGLELLREGLQRLGLKGPGLKTRSDDEMDAITSAIVGRYFESGSFEPMGIPSEAQLIIPKIRPLVFKHNPVICLAGKTGAGKSVVARYLSVFYGFEWVRTRNIIRDLLLEDMRKKRVKKMFKQPVNPNAITEKDLRDFGAIILNEYQQAPLVKMLSNTIKQLDAPVVVDSIRDTVDVDTDKLGNRPMLLWFVDCNDSIIQHRLAEKSKLGEKRVPAGSPVDRTAPAIRAQADKIIPNSGSLEELRWRIDDTLFQLVHIPRQNV
jgi:histidinol phosphatase-like PHP family hydrolase/predicted nuclease with RNAse H fold/dephospho-CoA kinase